MRMRFTAAIAGAFFLAACSDSTGPASPSQVLIAQGDEQGGVPGDFLLVRVQVLTSSGSPAAGVSVAWSVTSGDATIAPATINTAADGTASASVHLGTLPGPVVVAATVTGVTPASFNLSNDACNYLPSFTIGVGASGRLSPSDCELDDGSAIDFYDVSLAAQQHMLFTMTSGSYQGYLFLQDATGRLIAETFDDPVDSTSSVRALLAAGHYIVSANAYNPGTGGNYRINGLIQPTDAGCPTTWITHGIDFMQTSTGGACPWLGGFSTFEHFLVFADLDANPRAITVDVTGTNFAATVILGDGNLATRATATASGPGQPATVTYTPSTADINSVGPIFYIEIQGAGATAQAYRLVVH